MSILRAFYGPGWKAFMEAPQTCGSGEIFWDTNMHSGMPFYDFTFSKGGSGFVLYVLGWASSQKDRGARVRAIF
jgi:hypothetical protein